MSRYKRVLALPATDAAYIAGLVDGEGTITMTRRHRNEHRQLVVSISSTEEPLLSFVLSAVGAGKITAKRTAKSHHAPSFAYAISNRQALELLAQIGPYLRSYKAKRAQLVLAQYVGLTPRNGKYSAVVAAARLRFEDQLLAIRAR